MMRPIVVLLGFPCFTGILGVLGSWGPYSRFILFDPKYGLSTLRKHYVLKGRCPIVFKMAKRPKGQMVPFSRMYRGEFTWPPWIKK